MSNTVPNQTSQMANGDAFQAIGQGTTEAITTSATSQPYAAMDANTNIVRVSTVLSAYILIKSTETAVTTANGILLQAASVDYFSVRPGDVITVLQGTGAGICSITQGL